MFNVIRIPALKDNYIWLLRKGAAAAVVDPGDAAPVLDVLAREGLTLSAILITHHHQDHQGGVGGLLEHTPSVEVFGPERESITGVTAPLRGGERIRLASLGLDARVIAVPGHTLGHLAYSVGQRLFCGDTLFGGGCGRLFEGTPAAMAESLAKLAAFPDDTLIHCAHEYTEANLRFALAVEPGNRALRRRADEVAVTRAKAMPTVPSTLALEKATNPFLRCEEPEVVAAARAHGAGADDPVAVFAAIRAWKDSF
ncbi:MAG: hydroxyacylglutathione hydrolase [Candidatus Accumulibacter sp.]|jgi:hydroxyacylglutathione hydrolase|nr:hydroxyacylglutathione hydrolase [Accumulibacter sp.]